MPIRAVAAAVAGAALIFSPPSRAAETPRSADVPTPSASVCADAPPDRFRPEEQLRSVVENVLRYRIAHVAVDGGCYAVLASDRRGTPFDVRFRGDDLRMVSRYVVKRADNPAAGQ